MVHTIHTFKHVHMYVCMYFASILKFAMKHHRERATFVAIPHALAERAQKCCQFIEPRRPGNRTKTKECVLIEKKKVQKHREYCNRTCEVSHSAVAATKVASSIHGAASFSRRSYSACCCSPIVFRLVEFLLRQSVSIAGVVNVAAGWR